MARRGTAIVPILLIGGVVVGALWLSTAQAAPRWQEGAFLGYGVTIVKIDKTFFGYRYYVEFAELSGVIFGPLTEQEVLMQIGA